MLSPDFLLNKKNTSIQECLNIKTKPISIKMTNNLKSKTKNQLLNLRLIKFFCLKVLKFSNKY